MLSASIIILTLNNCSKMEELIEKINAAVKDLTEDLERSKTNKAAAARVRKATLVLEKLGKEYRKASVAAAKK